MKTFSYLNRGTKIADEHYGVMFDDGVAVVWAICNQEKWNNIFILNHRGEKAVEAYYDIDSDNLVWNQTGFCFSCGVSRMLRGCQVRVLLQRVHSFLMGQRSYGGVPCLPRPRLSGGPSLRQCRSTDTMGTPSSNGWTNPDLYLDLLRWHIDMQEAYRRLA